MRPWCLAPIITLVACDIVSGLDNFAVAPDVAATSAPGGTGGMGGAAGADNSGGTGGSATGGNGGQPPTGPPSCHADVAGAGDNCGVTGDDDCCASIAVPGGTYLRSYDYCEAFDDPPFYEATVSPFRLDKYEVTVGRFRQFLAAYDPMTVLPGFGAHEHIADTGWRSDFAIPRAVDIENDLGCSNGNWTADPGNNEHLPINCVNWYTAFVFCAWDGGRLPTEAEFNFVAAHGDVHNMFPWGNSMPSDDLVVWTCDGCSETPMQRVGSKPNGASFWGHLDVSGNAREWIFDVSTIGNGFWCSSLPSPCVDCARTAGSGFRIRRGGAHDDWYELRAGVRRESDAASRSQHQGFRCARPAP